MALLTVDEVCERLRLTESTVRKFVKRGDLAYFKLGRFVRVSEEDLADFMERRYHRVAERWRTPAPAAEAEVRHITERRHRRAG